MIHAKNARLRRNAVVSCMLGLGIAACVTSFSVINAILLRPLPLPEGRDLIWAGAVSPSGAPMGLPISIVDALSNRLAEIGVPAAPYYRRGATLRVGDRIDRVAMAPVGGNMFGILGVKAQVGRVLLPQDDRPGATRLAVISDSLWRSVFGASDTAVGTTITLDDDAFRIVGVMPASFQFPDEQVSVWSPIEATFGSVLRSSDIPIVSVIGRLPSGRTIANARAAAPLAKPDRNANEEGGTSTVVIHSLHDHMVRALRPGLLVLAVASAALLAVACLAAVTMQLAHLTDHKRDLAIRAALGASTPRLLRRTVVESAIVASIAGLLGLALSHGVLVASTSLGSQVVPEIIRARIDWQTALYAFAVSAVTACLLGLAPLALLGRLRPASVLQESSRGASEGRLGVRIRDVLLILSTATSLALLIGSFVLTKSLIGLWRVDLGYEPREVVRAVLRLPFQVITPSERERIRSVAAGILSGARQMGGVTDIAISTTTPGEGFHSTTTASAFNAAYAVPVPVAVAQVSPGYFATLRIPILRGRDFHVGDDADAPPVALIDAQLARMLFPDGEARGERFRFDEWGGEAEVIGVVRNARLTGRTAENLPQVYVPFAQQPLPFITVLARGSITPPEMRAQIASVVSAVDPTLPLLAVGELEDVAHGELARPQFYALVVGALAAAAMMLSCLGLYATVLAIVSNRKREIGIRIALGAEPVRLAATVIRRVTLISLGGILLGWPLAIGTTTILRSLLYGVRVADPVTYIECAVLVLGTAVLAAYLPARRATAADPMTAVRD